MIKFMKMHPVHSAYWLCPALRKYKHFRTDGEGGYTKLVLDWDAVAIWCCYAIIIATVLLAVFADIFTVHH